MNKSIAAVSSAVLLAVRNIHAALNASLTHLPRLGLAFMGSPEDAQLVRHAVEAKGGPFVQAKSLGS
jgi:hypothetical protein